MGLQLLARLKEHLDGASRLSEEELTLLWHVAGFYESVYRRGVFSRRRNLLVQADAHTTLIRLTTAVPMYVSEDIAEHWLVSVDSTIVRAHQHAAGARKGGSASPASDAPEVA